MTVTSFHPAGFYAGGVLRFNPGATSPTPKTALPGFRRHLDTTLKSPIGNFFRTG